MEYTQWQYANYQSVASRIGNNVCINIFRCISTLCSNLVPRSNVKRVKPNTIPGPKFPRVSYNKQKPKTIKIDIQRMNIESHLILDSIRRHFRHKYRCLLNLCLKNCSLATNPVGRPPTHPTRVKSQLSGVIRCRPLTFHWRTLRSW